MAYKISDAQLHKLTEVKSDLAVIIALLSRQHPVWSDELSIARKAIADLIIAISGEPL